MYDRYLGQWQKLYVKKLKNILVFALSEGLDETLSQVTYVHIEHHYMDSDTSRKTSTLDSALPKGWGTIYRAKAEIHSALMCEV